MKTVKTCICCIELVESIDLWLTHYWKERLIESGGGLLKGISD